MMIPPGGGPLMPGSFPSSAVAGSQQIIPGEMLAADMTHRVQNPMMTSGQKTCPGHVDVRTSPWWPSGGICASACPAGTWSSC